MITGWFFSGRVHQVKIWNDATGKFEQQVSSQKRSINPGFINPKRLFHWEGTI